MADSILDFAARIGELIKAARWELAGMPGTANFDDYKTPGAVPVSTSNGKTNAPVAVSGTLHVAQNGSGIVTQRYVTGEAIPRAWVRRFAGTWGRWYPDSPYAASPASGTDWDTLRTFAVMPITSASHPNQPVPNLGTLEVLPASNDVTQRFTTWESVARIFHRRYINNAWQAWSQIGAGSGGGAVPTKRVGTALTLSGGTDNNQVRTDFGGRLLLDYGATIPRWRLHVRNFNVRDSIAFPGALNMVGMTVGEAESLASNGAPTGRFIIGTQQQVVAPAATPADGSEWVSGWIDYPLEASKRYMLSYGFTAAAGQEVHYGAGAGWNLTAGSSVVHDTGVYGSRTTLMPLDIWLEAEVPTHVPVYGVLGDSLAVGHSSTSPVHDSFLAAMCRSTGALPVFWAASGDTLGNFTNPTSVKMTRYDGMARPDVLFMAMGGNDIFGTGTDLATTQARFHTTMNEFRKHSTSNVVLCSVWPRLDPNTPAEDVRQAYNNWLATTLPGGAAMYLDTASVLAAPDGRTVDTKWTAGPTNIHLSTAGYARAAAAMRGTA